MIATVLVVEDRARVRRALAAELRRSDFETIEAPDGEKAWEEFSRCRPDLVITDLVMPTCDGQTFLERITAASSVPVLMYSSRGTIRAAVEALKAGAVDFLTSSDTSIDDIVASARAAIESHRSRRGDVVLEKRLSGESPGIRRLRERIVAVAPLKDPVLVVGEPGSGLAEVVEILHELGCAGQEQVKLHHRDCAIETGFLPLGCKGSVFLRNVDRLEATSQAAWAKHLVQRRSSAFQDGGRIFASTGLPIASLERSGFHPGLFRLLSPHALEVPSLRDRQGDLGAIADALVEQFAHAAQREVTLSEDARELVIAFTWPGNLAQMSRVLSRAVTFSPGRVIQPDDMKEFIAEGELSVSHFRREHASREREILIRTMHETGGNIKRTAEILGKSRAAIYRLLEKHRTSGVDFR